MIHLAEIHLINPGENLVMCTKMRKDRNYTDIPALVTCERCLEYFSRNIDWWRDKLPKETKIAYTCVCADRHALDCPNRSHVNV